VFENRVLGLRDEVTGEWRKLHNEELNIYSPNMEVTGEWRKLHE